MDKQLHEQAIEDIAGLGGAVDTDDRVPGNSVVGVNLDRSRVTDSVLTPLQNLNRLHYLILSQTLVTDKVLIVLRTHPEIRRLNISDTLITDNGLKYLKYGRSLEELYLGDTITNKGLKYVKDLERLRILAIEDTMVTDKGFRPIASLNNLECLFLSRKQVSTESVRWLTELCRLQTVNLLGHSNFPDDPALLLLKTSLPNVQVEW